MKQIKPTANEHQWPRNAVKSVECRKRDLVIRITNWMRDKHEPAYDVECFIGGVFDFNESKSFTRFNGNGRRNTPNECKVMAKQYAQEQISKLL